MTKSSEHELLEERAKNSQVTIAMALKACVKPDAWAHGSIVAKVYAYQVKWHDPDMLQTGLLEIIEESNRRACTCPWVE
jgi:hypothetical protein